MLRQTHFKMWYSKQKNGGRGVFFIKASPNTKRRDRNTITGTWKFAVVWLWQCCGGGERGCDFKMIPSKFCFILLDEEAMSHPLSCSGACWCHLLVRHNDRKPPCLPRATSKWVDVWMSCAGGFISAHNETGQGADNRQNAFAFSLMKQRDKSSDVISYIQSLNNSYSVTLVCACCLEFNALSQDSLWCNLGVGTGWCLPHMLHPLILGDTIGL